MNTQRLQAIYDAKWYHVLPVKVGMILEIHEKVGEGSNQRIWKFKGTILKVKKPNQPDGTFLIRGETARMTIEKIYPLSFDKFEKIIILDENKVRRSKLYYLRDKVGKGAKLKSIIDPQKRNTDMYATVLAEKQSKQVATAPVAEPEAPAVETTDEAIA
jgi:large subunit ribosomal protein L19